MEHAEPSGSGIAIVFDGRVRAHTSLTRDLEPVLGFLADPGVDRVAPLLARDAIAGRYTYGTDAVISLAELLARCPGPAGLRAALELLLQLAPILDAARARASAVGLAAHGCLTPWRIALRADGSPVLLGYGLPDAPLVAYLDGHEAGVSLDTLRYATPERLDDLAEGPHSEIYALGLIAAEMVLGQPVFDGSAEVIAERVLKGDAPELIEARGAALGDAVLDLLCVATEASPDERFQDLDELSRQARPLLARATGPTLQDLVSRALAARSDADDPPTDVLMKPGRRAAPAPPPHDDEFDTEAGLESDFELVAPVPELGPTPSLEGVRAHARAIVERTRQLAEQADAMQVIAGQRARQADGVQPLLRKLKEAVAKAHKAASSTTNTSKLVELDDQVDDARMTLEMVRSAEKLCVSSVQQALELLYRIQSEVDQARSDQQAMERAARLAQESSERARDAARDAVAIGRELDARLAAGVYVADLAREIVGVAREHASNATAAAVRAKQASQAATGQERSVEAERDAQRAKAAADDAVEALAAIRRSSRQLDDAEAEAREVQASRLRASSARARSAALTAGQSLQRARTAASQATIPAGMDLLRAIEHHASAASEAAARCEARTQPILADEAEPLGRAALRRAAVESEEAAEVAENQAREASNLSDRLIALAGAAAAAAADLSKARAESDALLSRIQERIEEVRSVWYTLASETEEVTGRAPRDALQIAQRAIADIDRGYRDLLSDAERLGSLVELPQIQPVLDRMRDREPELHAAIEQARGRCREARAAASRELEEIAVRNAARRELEVAVERANEHAQRCRAAVAAAWARYQEAAAILSSATVDSTEGMRARAYEIIDIAEFQAGEAESAARFAAAQTDAAEARSHASTAASFELRITEDLPEAIALLDQAVAIASEVIGKLREARERTGRAFEEAREAVRVLEDLRAAGREAALNWSEDPSVALALDQLEGIGVGLDEDLAEVRYASERASQVEHADAALEMVPLAEEAARRLTAARARAEGAAATLDAAVRTARQEVETREVARTGVAEAVSTMARLRSTLSARSERLYTAVERNQASGETARGAVLRMRAVNEGVALADERIRDASRRIREAPTASEARAAHHAADAAIAEVERLLEEAAEAETEGVSAAEREAVEREASESRQLEHARAAALTHVNTAKHAAEKGVGLLRESSEELLAFDDAEVRSLHDKAQEWVRVARTAATGALKAARECQRAQRSLDAIDWEQRAGALAGDATSAVAEAHGLLRQAVDLARRAEAEAKALASVKAEITSIRVMIEEGVQQAAADLQRVLEITNASTDPDTLACNQEAEAAVAAVQRAATKVQAAAPLALQADDLDGAQGLLESCRMALERADESADTVRELIQRAQQLRSEEANRAAARLAAARSAAERPAEEARVIAEKAADWLAAGEEDAQGSTDAEVLRALAELREAAEDARRLAMQAETAAQPARRAVDVATANSVGEKVRAAAERTDRAAERARQALEALRAGQAAVAERERAAQEHRIRAAEFAAVAEGCAADGTAIVEALERHLGESGIEDDAVARTFREAKRAAKAIAAAAAAAFEATESSMALREPDAVRDAAEAVDARRKEAEAQLVELQRLDRTCRELIDDLRRRTREENKRQKDEALRAKLRRRRNESQSVEREALKERLAERDEPDPPNLSALRERLRARRKGSPGDGPRLERRAPARPEPDGDTANGPRARRRRPPADEASRPIVLPDAPRGGPALPPPAEPLVAEARTDTDRAASRQRREERRRRRGDGPEPGPRVPAPPVRPRLSNDPPTRTEVGIIVPGEEGGGSEGADALLRRLRRKRRDED